MDKPKPTYELRWIGWGERWGIWHIEKVTRNRGKGGKVTTTRREHVANLVGKKRDARKKFKRFLEFVEFKEWVNE